MKIYKFSVFLVFITLIALLYVNQQVQLLKISYSINTNEKEVTRLLDQNRSLVYNVTKLKSPVYLDNKFLASKKDFAIPQQWQVVHVTTNKSFVPTQNMRLTSLSGSRRTSEEDTAFGRILRIFGKPREAFANTVK